jgi:hypothetical protein
MGKKFPIRPAHPERTCWGCDRYCPAGDMICGNGTERTQHPIELGGEGWEAEGLDPVQPAIAPPDRTPRNAG